MKNLDLLGAAALALIVTNLALAHPHLAKTITVKLPAGGDATISYSTEPSNESYAANAAVGSFLHAGGVSSFLPRSRPAPSRFRRASTRSAPSRTATATTRWLSIRDACA